MLRKKRRPLNFGPGGGGGFGLGNVGGAGAIGGSGINLGSAGEAWTPLLLGASLLAWWTADRPDLMTLSGAQVSSWRDVVGGYDLVQAVGGSRPTYSATSFNGAPGLTFDGVDDEMTLATLPAAFPTGAAPVELWGIVQQDALPGDVTARRWFSYGGNTGNDNREARRSVAAGVNKASASVGTGAASAGANSVPADDFTGRHLHRVVITATDITQYVDGVASTPVAAVPATAATRVRVGLSTNGAGPWNGKGRDKIVTSLLTTDQAAALQAWAMPRRML